MFSTSEYLIDSFGNERRELADETKQYETIIFPMQENKYIHPRKQRACFLLRLDSTSFEWFESLRGSPRIKELRCSPRAEAFSGPNGFTSAWV